MAKKIIALVAAFIMIFTLASCGKKGKEKKPSEKLVIPEKKVAIIVAPEAKYPEDYRAAQKLAEKYPQNVVIKEYKGSYKLEPGIAEITVLTKEIAADQSIGALIYPKAPSFTNDAIREAKKINPDLHFICIEPEAPLEKLGKLCDAVICADWKKAANDIVSAAKEQGAEHFLMFSMNRHVYENVLYASEREFIKRACEAQGLKFIYDNGVDPYSTDGEENAKLYIREAIARRIMNNDVPETGFAVYSTDASVQSTLIEAANNRGLVYVSPSFPTAYSGVCEVYPAESGITELSDFVKSVKAAATADTTGKAKLSVYNYPLAEKMIAASLNIAFDLISGNATAENISEKAIMRISDISADKDFSVEPFPSDDYNNVFDVYYPGYEIIR